MTTRRRITKMVEGLGLKVVNLAYDRRYEYVYGDGHDDSKWILVASNGVATERWEFYREELAGRGAGWLLGELRELATESEAAQ